MRPSAGRGRIVDGVGDNLPNRCSHRVFTAGGELILAGGTGNGYELQQSVVGEVRSRAVDAERWFRVVLRCQLPGPSICGEPACPALNQMFSPPISRDQAGLRKGLTGFFPHCSTFRSPTLGGRTHSAPPLQWWLQLMGSDSPQSATILSSFYASESGQCAFPSLVVTNDGKWICSSKLHASLCEY